MAAGLATLNLIDNGSTWSQLESTGKKLIAGLNNAAEKSGVPTTINRVGSMFTVFFSDSPVTDFASSTKSDTDRFARFFSGMLKRGVLLPPSQFEAAFISTVQDEDVVSSTIAAAEEAFLEC